MAVWSVIADYASDAEWRAGLVEMTRYPPGLPRAETRRTRRDPERLRMLIEADDPD